MPGTVGLCEIIFTSYLGCKDTKRNNSRSNTERKVEEVACYMIQLNFSVYRAVDYAMHLGMPLPIGK